MDSVFKTLFIVLSLILASIGTGQADPAIESIRARSAPSKPNHNIPKLVATRTRLETVSSPTVEDIFQARVFEEPLVPVGGEPSQAENTALAAALLKYSQRSGPDDFSALAAYLSNHPGSAWNAALLTDLGLEYYNTAHYSLALESWGQAWELAKGATEARSKAIADRALGELLAMHARVGHMSELGELLKSVEGRSISGPATERIADARAGLADMIERPGISFRCGPLALLRIVLASQPAKSSEAVPIIHASASTQRGFSLRQVAELSRKIGLNYQMARREQGSAFIVPSVVHWKVGHYAALIRRQGDRYLLQDPTFRNDVWATTATLEEETSGYFVVPTGTLPGGWSAVESAEGDTIWGKGNVGGPGRGCGGGPPGSLGSCLGMAVSGVDLLFISLSLTDDPVGYSPPVGPAVRFTVHYNQRDPAQPSIFSYSNFGPKWTLDWLSYITDNPMSPGADVEYYRMGGFNRYFTGFDTNSQTFSYQLYDRTRLTRISSTTYEMLSGDGSKLVFAQPDGSTGTSRKVFLTQVIDPFGNVVTLTYDGLLRLAAITDAIGQVSTITYGNAADIYKVTKITDPFGRFSTFDYDSSGRLAKITDVIGLTSQFNYDSNSDFITALLTPYGTTSFAKGESGTTRSLETTYPDGTKERAEFNESTNLGIAEFAPTNQVPGGMGTHNDYLYYRNTYYWSRTAYANSYPDYTKAKIYHWLHTSDLASAARILESTKEPLENRVWNDYAGQIDPLIVGTNNQPTHVGRVLDDGSTHLRTYTYDGFGHVTTSVDPIGRTFSYIYSTNGIDLLEVRQTRAGNNELLSRMTYNTQHLPLTRTDAAGQTTIFTYNARGQLLTSTNPKGETTTTAYDTNGYLIAVDGPLPGTSDVSTATYDAFGRVQTKTDVSGYTLTFTYDALDHLTKITNPDSSYEEFTYDRLDPVLLRDRAGRQTLLEYNNVRLLTKRTDPLGRVTRFQWCTCGDLSSLTDPMGRTTFWNKDLQGRVTSKQYGDGSQIQYSYEDTTSRVRQVIDEKLQVSQFAFNRDDTLKSTTYANAAVSTPGVSYTYDPNYERITSITDGTGTTLYAYNPLTASPTLGAGQLASVDGPLLNDTITYGYDQLGRRITTAINEVASTVTFDPAGRVATATNALGRFGYAYDGASSRMVSETFPNGQNAMRNYGDNLSDNELQRITYTVGTTPISEFIYGRDIPAARIINWSQQAGMQLPSTYSLSYDAADQILSAAVTNSGNHVNSFGYDYDPAGNRLTELANGGTNTSTYNALNELTSSTASGASRTNEWDAADRLVAVTTGNDRTEFTYDGLGRPASIRKLTNGSEVSLRRLMWCDDELCEERDAAGAVTKRFFPQGVQLASGSNSGSYFYTRDHLGSVRELTDSSGNVRARFAYDPFGRQTKVAGDLETDFGFTGLFWANEASLCLARFRAYDPEKGRWLSRDQLENAEMLEGPNLYAYTANNPINVVDPLGLCCENEAKALEYFREKYVVDCDDAQHDFSPKYNLVPSKLPWSTQKQICRSGLLKWAKVYYAYLRCMEMPCQKQSCKAPPPEEPHQRFLIIIPGKTVADQIERRL